MCVCERESSCSVPLLCALLHTAFGFFCLVPRRAWCCAKRAMCSTPGSPLPCGPSALWAGLRQRQMTCAPTTQHRQGSAVSSKIKCLGAVCFWAYPARLSISSLSHADPHGSQCMAGSWLTAHGSLLRVWSPGDGDWARHPIFLGGTHDHDGAGVHR